MGQANGQTGIIDFYTDVVLPALAERLDTAFPEFGWHRDSRGWVATNEETTHRVLGVRAERVVAHGPAPRGFLVHGGEPTLWTAYLNGGHPPRGLDFVRAVRDLAERAGVDVSPLERKQPRDRRAELLDDFFRLAVRELASERGTTAREYLVGRGIRESAAEESSLGLVPDSNASRKTLLASGYSEEEMSAAGVLADGRWPGRICGAWRDERGQIRTIWARTLAEGARSGGKYLYLRGASKADLPPYGLWEVPPSERCDLVLVEGLLDAHHFRANGIPNVVAVGGTNASSRMFERLAHRGIEAITICFDRDAAGRTAAARVVERAAGARQSPTVFVLDPERLAPFKDPDEFLRGRGREAWLELQSERACGIAWRAGELLEAATPGSATEVRRRALARAGGWLGSLPPRLSIEQEDAVSVVANTCGYSADAATRAFRARFWRSSLVQAPHRERVAVEPELG